MPDPHNSGPKLLLTSPLPNRGRAIRGRQSGNSSQEMMWFSLWTPLCVDKKGCWPADRKASSRHIDYCREADRYRGNTFPLIGGIKQKQEADNSCCRLQDSRRWQAGRNYFTSVCIWRIYLSIICVICDRKQWSNVR